MANGIQRVYTATIASAATLSAALNLQRTFKRCYLEVGSLTSNSNIHLQAAASESGTYRRVVSPVVNTATVGHNTFTIGSAATGRIHELPPGLQWIKIETTATMDSGESFKVLCLDD